MKTNRIFSRRRPMPAPGSVPGEKTGWDWIHPLIQERIVFDRFKAMACSAPFQGDVRQPPIQAPARGSVNPQVDGLNGSMAKRGALPGTMFTMSAFNDAVFHITGPSTGGLRIRH
jgi:hypothetical protein